MHNENRSRQTQSTATEVSNLNVQDTDGVTVVGDGNVVTSADYGAIENAADIARSALDGARETNRDVVDLGFEAFGAGVEVAAIGSETVLESQRESFDFARDILKSSQGASADSVDAVLRTGLDFFTESTRSADASRSSALSAAGDAYSGALTLAGDAFGEFLRSADDSRDAAFALGDSLFDRVIDAGRDLFATAIDTAKGALGSAQANVSSTVSALQGIAKEQTTSDSARLQQVTLYALGAVAAIVIFGGRLRG